MSGLSFDIGASKGKNCRNAKFVLDKKSMTTNFTVLDLVHVLELGQSADSSKILVPTDHLKSLSYLLQGQFSDKVTILASWTIYRYYFTSLFVIQCHYKEEIFNLRWGFFFLFAVTVLGVVYIRVLKLYGSLHGLKRVCEENGRK